MCFSLRQTPFFPVPDFQEGGAELCLPERDRQHGADHAEPGETNHRPRHGEENKGTQESHSQDGLQHQPQRSVSETPAADWPEHVWWAGAGVGTAG